MIKVGKFYIILMITATIIIAGCCLSGKKKTTNTFNNQIREWMIYSKNDTLIFDSNNNESEFLHIYEVYHDTVPRHEKFSCDLVEDEVYNVEIVKFPNKEDNYYSSGFNLYNDKTRFDLLGYYCEDFHTLKLTEYTIQQQTYNDVWFSILQHYDGKSTLKVYYSKSKGLLEYEYDDGRKFTRKNLYI